MEFDSDSIGHQVVTLGARFFVGLAASKNGRTLAIRDVKANECESSREHQRKWDLHFQLTLDGESLETTCTLRDLVLEYPFDAGCTKTVEAKLQGYFDEPSLMQLGEDLAHATAPALRQGTFAQWVATEGAAYLADDASGRMASVAVDTGTLDIVLTNLAIDEMPVAIRMTLEVVLRDHEGVEQNRREQEIYNGFVDADCFYRSAEGLTKPEYADLARRYRAEIGRRALACHVAGDGFMPSDLMSDLDPIFGTVQHWLREGVAPPVPVLRAPELENIERRVSDFTSFVPTVDLAIGAEMLTNAVGYRIDGYELLLAAGADGALGLFLQQDSAPVLLMCSDSEAQNRSLYTIDGDAPTMRRLVRWMKAMIVQAGLDLAVVPAIAEDEENDIYEEDEVRASSLLERGNRVHPFDWRLSRDAIVADRSYWDSHDEYLPPPPDEDVRRIRAVDIPLYYRFWRNVLDPAFVGDLVESS